MKSKNKGKKHWWNWVIYPIILLLLIVAAVHCYRVMDDIRDPCVSHHELTLLKEKVFDDTAITFLVTLIAGAIVTLIVHLHNRSENNLRDCETKLKELVSNVESTYSITDVHPSIVAIYLLSTYASKDSFSLFYTIERNRKIVADILYKINTIDNRNKVLNLFYLAETIGNLSNFSPDEDDYLYAVIKNLKELKETIEDLEVTDKTDFRISQ